MVGQQRSARRRHEGRQAPQPLQGIEEQRRGAVAPGPAELIQELTPRALRQPLHGQGRTQDVAADLLQLIPPPRRHRHIRMETEALKARRTPPGRRRGGRRAEPAHRLPGAGPQRHAALQRRRHRARESRRLGRERIAPGVLTRPPPPADQELPHPALYARQKPRDVRIGRGWEAVELRPRRRARARVDASTERVKAASNAS